MDKLEVYLEVGPKKKFASAVEWPGWSRSGRDEASALSRLFEYGPRYAQALASSGLEFRAPADPDSLVVVERLKGSASTDFGVPDLVPPMDLRPMDQDELERSWLLLQGCWQTFDAAAGSAVGKELSTGPRGGGRSLEQIIAHVVAAEAGYLAHIGWRYKRGEETSLDEELQRIQEAVKLALASAARGELPARGPRGGVYWPPRYFVRRVAWHALDHAWEIEDRRVR